MLKSATRPLTVHDSRELPEGPLYSQLIEGNFFVSPSPDLFHQDILLNLAGCIGNYLEEAQIQSALFRGLKIRLANIFAR